MPSFQIILLMILPSLILGTSPVRAIYTHHILSSSFVIMKPSSKHHWQRKRKHAASESPSDPNANASSAAPLYRAQGLVAIHKPLTWTSQDVVSYIRGILTRDAQDRNAVPSNSQGGDKRGKKKKQMMMKVGHGGTLDPLASGEFVYCFIFEVLSNDLHNSDVLQLLLSSKINI